MDYEEKQEKESDEKIFTPEKEFERIDCIRPDLHHDRDSDDVKRAGVVLRGTANH